LISFPRHSGSIQIRLPVLGISICLIEVGYPVFIWMKKTRFFWLVCILAMHAAIGLTMGMYLFALVMIVLNLAAFGVGIRVPFIRHPAGGTQDSTQFSSEETPTLPVTAAQKIDGSKFLEKNEKRNK
jgi:hypothetical protein